MAETTTSHRTCRQGARSSRSLLLGSVSAIALAQAMGAGIANATGGPCSESTPTPGTTIVTCSGTINTMGSSVSYRQNGIIQIESTATISTTDFRAHGIEANSFSGAKSVNSSGAISTTGDQAYGINSSSSDSSASIISNGAISTSGRSALGLYGWSSWNAVSIEANGAISTTGGDAHGIFGYGSVGVTITSRGAITTTGGNAYGIFGYGAGVGNVSVDITSTGSVTSSGNGAYAVYVLRSSAATATINNAGTVTGDVYLTGASGSSFNNLAGGVFNSGGIANLNGLTLNNAGTVSPGGTGTIRTTTLTGNYVQTSTGVLKVDADWTGNGGAGAADRLAITGTAALAGTVVVNPINFPTTGGLTKQFTILTADHGITNNGITIANTAAVNYALLFPDANTMNVRATINFQGVGLNNLTLNQNSVGGNLNTILGGGTQLPFMTSLMQIPAGGGLGGALNQLSPIGDGGSFSTAMNTGNTFGQQLLSCRMAGEETDTNRFIREGQCVWARVNARRFENGGRGDGAGYRENALFYSAGAQVKVAPDWRIGGGLGYETLGLTSDTNASSNGERLHVGGVVKYNPGPWLFAAGVTGGWGWHDNRRSVSFGGFGASATSSSESSFHASRLTAAYLLSRGALYLKPQVELASTHLTRDGYTERGTGGIALRVGKTDATVLSASPSLEIGLESRGAAGGVIRGYVKGGATFRDTDTFVTTASFADAPIGTLPFAISTRTDKSVADIGAGLDIISAGDTALRIQYDGQLGSRTTLHSGGAKLSVRF